MALVLHLRNKDETFVHLPFTKEFWEQAINDDTLAGRWGHDEDDCHDPVARLWADRRLAEFTLTPKQHAIADRDDPSWKGFRGLHLIAAAAAVPEPIIWPPASPLNHYVLSELTGLSRDECREILAPPRKVEKNRAPVANIKGQFLLFVE